MKLAVLGAGVVGVTTAFELVHDGHDVTVYERRQTPAEEASFSPGGLLAPEWAAARTALEWEQESRRQPWWSKLLGKRPAPRTNPGPALMALAGHSLARLSLLSEQLMPALGEQQGLMAIWREPSEHPVATRLHSLLAEHGCKAHLTDAEQARSLEAALNPDSALAGSLVIPDAWSANCRQFVLQLKAHARQSGCRFLFGTTVVGMEQGSGQQGIRVLSHQEDDSSSEQFDAVVVCAGQATTELAKTYGLDLQMDIRVAHALSGSIREPLDAPSATVHDLGRGITIARSGQWVRAVGPALDAARVPRSEAAFKPLYAALSEWFPGALRTGVSGAVQEWKGTVATTADALPLLGRTRVPGVWINAGHGMHGWLLACGCARVLADQLSGRPPALDTASFEAKRTMPVIT